MPKAAITTAIPAETQTFIEKIRLASPFSPSPIFMATSAAPPVPNMKPMQPRIISSGIMKLTAVNGVFPT